MGQGFPQIPTRDSYGPTYQNIVPPKLPEFELSAGDMNLMAWQMAAMGRTQPSAVLIGQDTGGGWALSFVARTYDPKEILTDPAVAAIANVREITFGVQHENEAGELRRFLPYAAQAFPWYADVTDQAAGAHIEISTYVDGPRVGIRWEDAGSPVAPVGALIQVWGGSV